VLTTVLRFWSTTKNRERHEADRPEHLLLNGADFGYLTGGNLRTGQDVADLLLNLTFPRVWLSEPCEQFLQRQHKERRCGYLHLRRRLFLFAPGILACWWGNVSRTRSHAWDIDLSRRAFELHSDSWLFILAAVGLVIAWIAFGKAAEKAARDREELLRITGDGTS
jgi:hypothetical protein